MKKCAVVLFTMILFQSFSFANSVKLFNDSVYTLKATMYDAGGKVLGQFILNPRDATEWSDDQMNFGSQMQDASQTPYTVSWFCMAGSPYGSCNNVAAGAVVTAQSCGGVQQCPQQQSGE